jgi:malate-CoA ligase subunit beta
VHVRDGAAAEPNFLDVGGGASPQRVATAFRLVLSDQNVRAILVNPLTMQPISPSRPI